jgi:hypothetical protein
LASKDRIGFLTLTDDPTLHFYLIPPNGFEKFVLPILKEGSDHQRAEDKGHALVAWGVVARS